MQVVIATHGHCFDGLASAVFFTKLLRHVEAGPIEPLYEACGYGVSQRRPDAALLCGAQNALLDYRFHPVESLTWYFDHHGTAFASDSDRAVFESRRSSGRYFFDPSYSSCTKLIADMGREHFGFRDPGLDELVRWADIVDSAAFDSPEQALDRTSPVMRLVSVVEHHGSGRFLTKTAKALVEQPLEEVARSSEIERLYRPIGDKLEGFVRRVRERGQRRGRVVLVDLTDGVLDTIGKFVTYALYPDAIYSVVVALLKNGAKISVGYNPWSGHPLDTDISAICARHGGGGHPVVGAISFRSCDVEQARHIAQQIAAELAG